MARLFGWEIKRQVDDEENENIKSFSIPVNDQGSIDVSTTLGGSYASVFNLDSNFKSESDLITQYRIMAMQPEVKFAVENIVNEAVSVDVEENVVKIILDNVNVGDKTKKRMFEEFGNIMKLLNFKNNAYEIFSKWYVDGRLCYNVVIDEKDLKRGIVELIYVDPRKLRLIREYNEVPSTGFSGADQLAASRKLKKEYYMFSENGFGNDGTQTISGQTTAAPYITSSGKSHNLNGATIRIAKDSVVRITSGLVSPDNSTVLSYLHSSIKPLNLLRSLEDANIIYTITRAPERRIFYVDVGDLPTAKAEQYVYNMMVKHKNKITYDNSSGVINDDRRFMTMTEDFWFPRREGSKATEITTIAGSGSLTDNEQMDYFKNNLQKSLNVPASRFESENVYSMGRVTEMTREEVMFGKFIRRLRSRFSELFDQLLEKQLVLRGVIHPDEWNEIRENIRYDFVRDNYFEELKSMEILRERIAMFDSVNEMIGKHFSTQWAYKKILFMTDEEVKQMRAEIDEETAMGYYISDEEMNSDEYVDTIDSGDPEPPDTINKDET